MRGKQSLTSGVGVNQIYQAEAKDLSSIKYADFAKRGEKIIPKTLAAEGLRDKMSA